MSESWRDRYDSWKQTDPRDYWEDEEVPMMQVEEESGEFPGAGVEEVRE